MINYLPKGSKYTVTETPVAGYHTVYTINGGVSTEGNTVTGTLTEDAVILFINSSGLMLPQTGGTGWWPYTIPFILGFIMMIAIPIAEKFKNKTKHIKGEKR